MAVPSTLPLAKAVRPSAAAPAASENVARLLLKLACEGGGSCCAGGCLNDCPRDAAPDVCPLDPPLDCDRPPMPLSMRPVSLSSSPLKVCCDSCSIANEPLTCCVSRPPTR